MNIKKTVLFGGLVSMGLFLLILPPDFFDRGESICLSRNLFDIECPGCGMTRAIMHLLHFDFSSAWEFNRLSFVLLPVLLFFYFRLLFKLYNDLRTARTGTGA